MSKYTRIIYALHCYIHIHTLDIRVNVDTMYTQVSSLSVDETLYTERDLVESMDRIETINYHEVVHHRGIKFWAYNAGHVLGAAMFMIEIAGVRILYTGMHYYHHSLHHMSMHI